ncbi:MAG: hypothetical protein PHV74_10390 [Dehalococcoidia bacterium]|nr:hypothetical protein [Dehalococcoidia bacterium]
MKRLGWQLWFGIGLVMLSVALYGVHYLLFKDTHHIFIYMVGDIAFLPFEVLLVTMVIHRLLSEREKQARLEKMNMVIGVFFDEMGTKLMRSFSEIDPNVDGIRKELLVKDNWSEQEFARASDHLRKHDYAIESEGIKLEMLTPFLVEKRDFMLRLMENPTLLEHESFTKLLRAVFHMTEELHARKNLRELPPADSAHIANDLKRVYVLLVHQWLDYMKYLKTNYPYHFSFAMRTNPFDRTASPTVQ